jgi:two-component system KDP operon response regulator KdpE
MQRTGNILIVDGDPTIAELLVEIVTDAGYAALTASDAPSVFWIIINYAPALLLLDIGLPDMEGPELIAQLRRAGVAAMPIVLMSTLPRNVEQSVPGACTYLAKPFDIDDLLTCVAGYVQPLSTGAARALGTEWQLWPNALE